ncbi:MAG: hypothetical protein ACRC24_04775 [Vibrionaceae bacterium]
MASSTPPPGSGRNAPLIDQTQVDESQNPTTAGSVPIVGVSASGQLPATQTPSTTAASGGTGDTGVIVSALSSPSTTVSQTQMTTPVADMNILDVVSVPLTAQMLENSGFSSNLNAMDTSLSDPNVMRAITEFLSLDEISDDSSLFFRLESYRRHGAPRNYITLHLSGISAVDMGQIIRDIDRRSGETGAEDGPYRNCRPLIDAINGEHRTLRLLDGADTRTILQQEEDRTSSPTHPIPQQIHRHDRRDPDTDASGAAAISVSSETEETTSSHTYTTVVPRAQRGDGAPIERVRVPAQAERQEEVSDESSAYQPVPSQLEPIAELGQLSDSIDEINEEGSAAREAEAAEASLTAVSLDDLNIPLFSGPIPTAQAIDEQILAISDTILDLDRTIAELEGRLVSSSSTRGSASTSSSALADTSIDPSARRASLAFTRPDSTTAAERREAGSEEADLEDDGRVPFSPARAEAPFIAPLARRASTASVGYDFTDADFDETASHTIEIARDTALQEEVILPSTSISQTGVWSAPAPYVETLDTPSTTTQADASRAAVRTPQPPAQRTIQQLSNADELAGLTPQSPIVQNATREDVAALTIAQLSALSRDVLLDLNQRLEIVRDRRSAIWTEGQIAAFMTGIRVTTTRRIERRSRVETSSAPAGIQRPQTQPSAPSSTSAPQLSFSTSSASASLDTSRPVAPLPPPSSAIGAEGFTPHVTRYTLSHSTTNLSAGGVHQRIAGLISGQPGATPASASARNLSATADVELEFDLPDTPQDMFVGMVRRYSAQRLAAPTSSTVNRLARIQARQRRDTAAAETPRPVFRENSSSTAGGNTGGVNDEDSDQGSDS